jgi:Secretion system C-terminal sorting domain
MIWFIKTTMVGNPELNTELTAPNWMYTSLDVPPAVDREFTNGGTSSGAAALITGVVSLMLSVNPCLNPAQVEKILKETASSITIPTGFLGSFALIPPLSLAGSVNAHHAVTGSLNNHLEVSGTLTLNNFYSSYSYKSIEVLSGGHLIIDGAYLAMVEDGIINVRRGGKLTIINDAVVTACSGRWKGILLDGNNDYSHFQLANNLIPIISNRPAQLFIEHSTLENAVNAFSCDAGYKKWNALVEAKQTTFSNNWRSVALMSSRVKNQPSETDNQFIGCTFTTDGTEVSNFGITNWDAQGVQIQTCNFFNIKRDAIHSIDGSFDISGCNIDNDLIYLNAFGIRLGATTSAQWETYIGGNSSATNTISRTRCAITVDGATNVIISHNRIRENILGVFVSGNTGSTTKNNDFLDNFWGIGQLSAGLNSHNAFNCNKFESNKKDLFDFYNFGYVFDTDFDGNIFSENRPSFKLFHEDEVPGISLVGIISNQGTEQNPRTNQFNTEQYCDRINSGNLNTEFDYWYPPTPSQQDPNFAQYLRMKATCSLTEPYNGQSNYYNSYSGANAVIGCTAGIGGFSPDHPDCMDRNCLQQLVSSVLFFRNSQPLEKSILDHYEKEAQATLLYLIQQSVSYNDYISAIDLLSNYSLKDVNRLKFGVLLQQGEFTAAELVLNNMALSYNVDDQLFVVAQRVNIRFRKSTGDFELTPSERANLNNIANAMQPASAYAQSLLMLFGNQFFDVITPKTEQKALESYKHQNELALVCYPNPSTGLVNLRCNFDRIGKKCSVSNIMGHTLFETSLETSDEIDLSTYPDGIYILSVLENGSILYRTQVVLAQ